MLTITATESPQTSYELWRLLGNLFVSLNIGEFKNDTLLIKGPFSDYDLQITLQTFSTLVNASVIADHDPIRDHWKFKLSEGNRPKH